MNCSTPANSTISSKLALDLAPLHAEDRAVQEDVLAAGELGMEARADLEQAADAAADHRAARGRRRDPRQDLEQGRLAGAVAADEPDDLAFANLEANVAQRPELARRAWPARVRTAERLPADERVPQRPVRCLHLPDAVALRELLRLDRERHQIVSANLARSCRKTARPSTKTRTTATERRPASDPSSARSRRGAPSASPRSRLPSG